MTAGRQWPTVVRQDDHGEPAGSVEDRDPSRDAAYWSPDRTGLRAKWAERPSNWASGTSVARRRY